jgi:hypothetical protein
MGTSTTAVTGDVELMLWGHCRGSNDRKITTNWGYASPVVGVKAMPNAIVASGLSYYSVPGTALDMYINRALASML